MRKCFLLTLFTQGVDANATAVEAHLKGLKRLIQLQGGLDNLDHMTVSKIYQCVLSDETFRLP